MRINWPFHLFVVLVGTGCANLPVDTYGDNAESGGVVSVNGTMLYYEEYGDGAPLVLLHGNGQSIAAMKNQIKHFSQFRKVFALDSRAHGKSLRGEGELTYELMAADVAQFLDKLQLAPAEVLGWSDGGNIALILALTEPRSVSKVAAMGATLNPNGAHDWAFPPVKAHKAALVEKLSIEPTEPRQTQLDIVNLLLEHPNIEPTALGRIEVPVLVIAGDEDIIRNEHTLEIYQSIPTAQLCILPGSTHFAPIADSDRFNAVVERFLLNDFTRPTSKAMLGID